MFSQPVKIQRLRGLGLVYFILPSWLLTSESRKVQAQVGVHTHLCFLLASIFYLKMNFVKLVTHPIPLKQNRQMLWIQASVSLGVGIVGIAYLHRIENMLIHLFIPCRRPQPYLYDNIWNADMIRFACISP